MKLRKEKTIQKIRWTQSWFFEVIGKTDKSRFTKEKRKQGNTKIQISEKKKRVLLHTLQGIKKLISKYYELHRPWIWELRWNGKIPQNHGRNKTNFHFSKRRISKELQNSANNLLFFFVVFKIFQEELIMWISER